MSLNTFRKAKKKNSKFFFIDLEKFQFVIFHTTDGEIWQKNRKKTLCTQYCQTEGYKSREMMERESFLKDFKHVWPKSVLRMWKNFFEPLKLPKNPFFYRLKKKKKKIWKVDFFLGGQLLTIDMHLVIFCILGFLPYFAKFF